MAFRVAYKVPKEQYEKFCDLMFWNDLDTLSVKQLLVYVFKYLRTTKILVQFNTNIGRDVLGRHFCGEAFDKIEFSTKDLTLQKLPSVLIHELLHGVFPQIETDDIIVKLERKIMSKITHKEINQILNLFFNINCKLEYHGSFSRRVGSNSKEREE